MPKDIRNIIKESVDNSIKLSKNHKDNFEKRLQVLHKPKKKKYTYLKVAASIILMVSLGYYLLPTRENRDIIPEAKIKNLGSVSPEMKQVESYYLTAINYEMASIETTPESKEILDAYLEKIALLTDQYKHLTNNLSKRGVNEKTINALITNLQLRLQLLLELKDTISELKTPKTIENENKTI